MEHEQRIAELEDELKQLRQRADELRLERDKERALVAEMREHVEDVGLLIENWIENFNMVLNDAGLWELPKDPWQLLKDERDRYLALRSKWNKFVPRYNAEVAPKRRNFGRPLAASEAQKEDVLKRRRKGQSLRSIAEEMNLGLQTVRTIVDKADGVDRATLARLERISPNRVAEARERANWKARAALPKRIAELQKRSAALIKRAKGLRDD